MAPFEIMFSELAGEVAARTGLEGRALKAATYDCIAESCEAAVREDPKVPAGACGIYVYREMARLTRSGEIP